MEEGAVLARQEYDNDWYWYSRVLYHYINAWDNQSSSERLPISQGIYVYMCVHTYVYIYICKYICEIWIPQTLRIAPS